MRCTRTRGLTTRTRALAVVASCLTGVVGAGSAVADTPDATDLAVAKQGPVSIQAPGTINFEIFLTNQGPSDIPVSEIEVIDQIMGRAATTIAIPPQARPVLGPGASIRLVVPVAVTSADCARGAITNTVRVRLQYGGVPITETSMANNTSQATTAVLCAQPAAATPAPPAPAPGAPAAPDAPKVAAPPAPVIPTTTPVIVEVARSGLVVDKFGPRRAIAGGTARYMIRVRNTGSVPLLDVRVRDELPGLLALSRVPRGARLAGGMPQFTIPRLGPGQVRVFTVDTRTSRAAGSCLVNQVHVTADRIARRTARAYTCLIRQPRPAAPKVTG